ncbi:MULTISPECIES: hypothetical protein [unclassified Butyrivibrio]|uniref:hypothetical protein n=1 Tax=unclassified Butyrivibrio TaxID=2639466 RepID=UPI0003B59AC5|nr:MULTISPECIES: hypothetical protein [unclassified Butyrivibrio]MDC7292482.1 hypothetical protein [Butyrivibrio sp. DSM 10294]
MDVIANNLPQFDGDIQDYNSGYTQLSQAFDQMVIHMNELNTMWEGEAHEELKNTFSNDQQKTQTMLDDVLRVYNELKFAHSEYTSCEQKVSGIINDL